MKRLLAIPLALLIACGVLADSIRQDSTGETVRRTATLPTIDPFTAMGWFYMVTDTAAIGYLFDIRDAGSNHFAARVGSGRQLSAEVTGITSVNGTTLSTTTWYHIALTRSGNTVLVYLNGVLDSTASTGTVTMTTPTGFNWGSTAAGGTSIFNGRYGRFKVWQALLTAAQIKAEMYHVRPLVTTNLWYWSPIWRIVKCEDYSGNGFDFTCAGSLSTEEGPAVGW